MKAKYTASKFNFIHIIYLNIGKANVFSKNEVKTIVMIEYFNEM